jgi:two-component system phosphate regulon sensor histidine kinase PhoR
LELQLSKDTPRSPKGIGAIQFRNRIRRVPPGPRRLGMKLLLLDHDARLELTCRQLLSASGHTLITAKEPRDALDLLSRDEIDILLLHFPALVPDGQPIFETAIKSRPQIPIVIITKEISADDALAYMEKGVYDFISDPIQAQQLLISIRRAQEKRKSDLRASEIEDEIIRALLDFNTEKKRLKTIINGMANGVMVTNEDLEVVLQNPALMRLLEISEEIRNPVPINKIIKDETLIATLKRILAGAFNEDALISQEIQMGKHTLRAISTPALGPDRKVFFRVSGTVTVFEDITAFKQLDRMKSDFVNMVAHELRSPLVSIRQMNSVLAEGLAGPLNEKQGEFVDKVQKKIDILLKLINDLLDVAKLEAGKYVRAQVPTDIGKIIEEMVAFMEPRAKAQGLTLTCVCENLKPIQADPKGIEEILNNLLSNAINYSPDGGQVTITARATSGYVEIKIKDTGIGIPQEELPKVFDKFYRVKHPKTRNVMGTGLGLSIVKGVVEAHRGSIDVESVSGQGTTFRILLPVPHPDSHTLNPWKGKISF